MEIPVNVPKTPKAPTWVEQAGKETRWAWKNSLSWRTNALQAKSKLLQDNLIVRAKQAYHE